MRQDMFREGGGIQEQGKVFDEGADVRGFRFLGGNALCDKLGAQGGPDDDPPVGVGVEAVLFQDRVQVFLQGQGQGDAQDLVVAKDDGRPLQV